MTAKRTKKSDGPSKRAQDQEKRKGDIQICIDTFHDEHLRRHGFKPLIVGGKHASLFKTLIASWGCDEVVRLIKMFFTTTDARVVRSDYKVEAFYALAQHLKLNNRRSGLQDRRTAENFDAAARAMQAPEGVEPDGRNNRA